MAARSAPTPRLKPNRWTSRSPCRSVSGLDASPTLVAAFREQFPQASVICEAAESSSMFGDHFDAVVAIGLMFLLRPETQEEVIRRVGRALKAGGRFLFADHSPAELEAAAIGGSAMR